MLLFFILKHTQKFLAYCPPRGTHCRCTGRMLLSLTLSDGFERTRIAYVAVCGILRILVRLISRSLANRRRRNLGVSAHQSTHIMSSCVDTILRYVTATSSGCSSKDDVITDDWSNVTRSIPDMTSPDGVTGASSASSSAHGSFDCTTIRSRSFKLYTQHFQSLQGQINILEAKHLFRPNFNA